MISLYRSLKGRFFRVSGLGLTYRLRVSCSRFTVLLRNQGEKSINFYFIMVPFKEKGIKVWYSKAQFSRSERG